MTEAEQKYNLLLQELAGLLKSKNDEIMLLKWEVADLKEKLEEAEGAGKNESERVGA